MPITSCAPTARYGWSYDCGRWVGVYVEGTTAQGKPCQGILKADNLQALKKMLLARGVSKSEVRRLTVERK